MRRIFRSLRPTALAVLTLMPGFCAGSGAADAATLIPDFSAAQFLPGTEIDHDYFPLAPGFQTTLRAEAVDDEGAPVVEASRLSFGGAGPVILGVETTIQRDRAFENGRIVEDTFDYYAQDQVGNVWYMGEDVTNYVYDDDGVLVETNNESAWIAGRNGALPGLIMLADPIVDRAYFQEIAPADAALDEALVWATGQTVTAGALSYDDVLITLETTQLDPDAREFKYYAPGLGLIRVDEGLDPTLANPELVFTRVAVSPVPLPAGLPMLGAALIGLAGWMHRKRR